ncbi:MAG: NAD(P)H-dependent oxidoreductase [Rhizonema sp. PD37]|nr:NAD(P)H-dependent oxidoreductase [Rhizonema sp. PD37]
MQYKVHLLSLSASEYSVSRACVDTVKTILTANQVSVSQSDVRDLPPVWVNGSSPAGYSPKYADLATELAQCDGYVLFFPVHCYSMASTAKVVTEVLFTPLKRRPMGFVTVAGGRNSFLAVRDMMSSLIFDSEALIFPKHVFLTEDDLDMHFKPGPEVYKRLEAFSNDFSRFVKVVKPFWANP